MKYKILNTNPTFGRIDPDGKIRESCIAQHPPFIEHLQNGGELLDMNNQPVSQEIIDQFLQDPEAGFPIDSEVVEAEKLEQWRKSASLSRRRFKIGEAFYKVNGTPLVQLIKALLAGLPEPQKTIASISYKKSNSFDRLDAFVVQFGQALEMSEEQVDDFFKFCINESWQ